MGEIRIISSKEEQVNLDLKLEKIIGKKVISLNGEILGKVKSIISKNNKIEGIVIKKSKNETYIDYHMIQDLYGESILLKIDPVSRLLNKKVFDAEGKLLGVVVDINQIDNKNQFKDITVKKKSFSKKIKVAPTEIEVAQKNIILNKIHNE